MDFSIAAAIGRDFFSRTWEINFSALLKICTAYERCRSLTGICFSHSFVA